ncbi:MAG: lipoyl synthase [Firmicutes bacterium]|nr:lipoyl synthase [Bacillota bacterium]
MPSWLTKRVPDPGALRRMRSLISGLGLHTVCENAKCPNAGDCFEAGTATFLILGDLCTRSCGFCSVESGKPGALDLEEPARVALAAQSLALQHVVVTSVTRDDLPDGGALQFARTIRSVREAVPGTTVEVLVPDFGGSLEALRAVADASPHILAHNVETVPRLYPRVRPGAGFERSLELLCRARRLSSSSLTKSGLMVGLGETREELSEVFRALREAGCDLLTVGQYLRPSPFHLGVERYLRPEEFADIKEEALELGFRHVEAAPFVRSSYHAGDALSRPHSSLHPR